MSKRPINNEVIDDTGFGFTLSLINGKYKMSILYCLTDSLKGLEKDGMILRTEYPQVPPKVEYSLTEKGKSFIPILKEFCAWGERNKNR